MNEFVKIFSVLFLNKSNLKESMKLFKNILLLYCKQTVINYDCFNEIIQLEDSKYNSISSYQNILKNKLLMLHVFYTDGGMYSKFSGTDSIHDEIVLYNYNNFLWVNPYLPIFCKRNKDINIIIGTYLKIDTELLYEMIYKFKYNSEVIKKYKQYNELITYIMDKNSFKIEDFFWANQIRENDIPENMHSVPFEEVEGDYESFFQDFETYYVSNYSDDLIYQKHFCKLAKDSNVLFLAKELKMINLKKDTNFMIFFSDSLENSHIIAEKKSENLLDSNSKRIISTNTLRISEFYVSEDNFVPLFYFVEILQNSEFEVFNLSHYILFKFIIIKKLQTTGTEFIIDDQRDFQDSWDCCDTLPKIFFFGSYLNTSNN